MNLSDLADLFGIVGFPLSLLSMYLTYREAKKAKSASEVASREVSRLRNQMRESSVIADLAAALGGIDELRRFARYRIYDPLHDRLPEIRRVLISVRKLSPQLSEKEEEAFQLVISGLQGLETTSNRHYGKGTLPETFGRSVLSVSQSADGLHEILCSLKDNIGNNNFSS